MKELKSEIKNVINHELARANKEYPLFVSNHEAYGVIKEELEEARDNIEYADLQLGEFWDCTKANDSLEETIEFLERGRKAMLLCACESVQTSAMFEKAIISICEGQKKDAEVETKWEELKILFKDLLDIEV